MALPSWWQVATPHADIVKGELDEAVFAADLGDVISGKAPQEYRDAELFFRKTYLTKGLQNLLENVLERLAGGKGSGVIQLQTPFGGGKTHALLALYHAVRNRERITPFENVRVLADALPADTKVACFVGTHADPLKGKTPWGSIAQQLGRYNLIKEHDKERVAPGKEALADIFQASGPTLILMDELLEYVVKAARAEEVQGTRRGQVLAFLQELTEVASSTPDLALVLTLPSSALEHYDEEAEKALKQLQKISGRVEAIFTPVEGMEIYEVIRTRLFEDLGEEAKRKEVTSAYFDLYLKMGSDAPEETREVAYREKMEKAYPFHPELIDVLYERWGSFPSFQRTRGVLRLLGLAVQDLWERKEASPLIHSSLLGLDNSRLRMEFIKHIGNEYDSIIAADIAGPDAKAAKIDDQMGSEYHLYGIARGIATSVFLYSFSGAEKAGITLPQLRVAVVREGIPPAMVGDAVNKLKDELWYFHSEDSLFSFTNRPNLNRVIIDREETVGGAVLEALKEELERLRGGEFDVRIWPRQPSDIPDGKKIKLAILSPDHLYPDEYTNEFVTALLSRSGEAYRAYRNVILALAMDAGQWANLEARIRRFLALKSLKEDEAFTSTLSSAGLKELEKKYREAKEDLPHLVFNAYRHLAASSPKGLRWLDMGMTTMGPGTSLSSRVKEYLRDQELFLSGISGRALLDKAFAEGEAEKSLGDVYEVFLRTPGMPLPESFNILVSSVKSAVKSGTLGLQVGKEVFFKEDLGEIPEDALVLRPGEAEKRKGKKLKPEDIKEAMKNDQALRAGELLERLSQDFPDLTLSILGETIEEAVKEGVLGLQKRGHVYLNKRPPLPIDADDEVLTREEALRRMGEAPPPPGIHRVSIRAEVPPEHLSSVIAGVINPLKSEGGVLNLKLEIVATSEQCFTRSTLDTKVKETLHQIAESFEWEEE